MPSVLAAITYAAGEQLNTLAGVRLTRLAQAAQVGDTTLVCERTAGMAAQGQVVVDQITYAYSTLADGILSGLSVTTPQGIFSNVVAAHALNALVTDATGLYSSTDIMRRGFFVDTAEGQDLAILGRILGVPKDASIADDSVYRAIIKAVAYSTRITQVALRKALDAMVGAGNYSLYEDPYVPATVFVSIAGDALLSALPQGKTYVGAQTVAQAAGQTLSLPGPIAQAYAAHVAPIAFYRSCNADSLSSQTPLVYDGGDEGTVQALPLGGALYGHLLKGPGSYIYKAPLDAAGTFCATVRAYVPDASKLPQGNQARACALAFAQNDAAGMPQQVAVGMVQVSATTVGIGFVGGNDALMAVAQTVPQGALFDLTLTGDGLGHCTLQVDGKTVATKDASSVATPNNIPGLRVGGLDGQTANLALVAVGLDAASLTDALSLYPSVTPQGTDTLRLSTPVQTSDVGLHLRVIAGGGASDTQPDARGDYVIAALVDASTLKVTGAPLPSLRVQAHTLQATDAMPFTYPDDLGRTVRITTSAAQNAGDYVITALLADDLATPLTGAGRAGGTPCSMAQVSGAALRPELAAQGVLVPNFGSRAAQGVLAYAHTATPLDQALVTLTHRGADALLDAPYVVSTTQTYSGEILADQGPFNHVVDPGPPAQFMAHPFYLFDPTSFIDSYLSTMVAAGVRLRVASHTEGAQ